MLLMYGNVILSITILSLMRNATIFISIQNQQNRMSYDYDNQLYNSICLILIQRVVHNLILWIELAFAYK